MAINTSADPNILVRESLLKLIFENAAVGIAQVDHTGQLIMVNNKIAEITGYSKEELLQKTFQEFTHPDDLEADLKQAEALYRGDIQTYKMEKRYIRKDGSVVWVKLNSSAIIDDNGNFNTYVGIIEDISEKKKAEKALKEKQEKITNILNNITDCYISLDRNWKLCEINKEAEREVFQQPAANLTGKVFWDLYPKGRGGIFHREYERAFRENLPVHFEAHSNVTDKWLEVHAYPQGDYLEIFFRDVTKRKNLENELRKSEQQFSKLFYSSPGFMFINDIESGAFMEVNDSFCELTGYSRQELIGKNSHILGVLPKAKRNEVIDQLKKSGDIKAGQTEIVDRKGQLHSVVYSAVKLSLNDHCYILSSGIDVTEQKIAAQALLENEKRLQLVLNNSHDGIHMVDLTTNQYVFMSPSQERLTGFTREELNLSMEEAEKRLHPDDVTIVDNYLAAVCSGKQPINPMEYRWRVKSGEYRWFSDSRKAVFNEKGKAIALVGISRDITELKKTQEALQESEEKLRNLANNMTQLAWMMDKDGWVFWYNKRWYDYTGTTLEEMKGWGWQKLHHPDHLNRVVQTKKRAVESGKVWEELFPLKGRDGQYRWFLTRAVPLKDENGTIYRWLGTNTDVTHQREIENKLKFDNKLFEDLLYISAHDLKGPVANMQGALDLMDRLPPEKKVMFLNRFRELADQLDKTIRGITTILHMRHDDKLTTSILNVDKLLDNVLSELNYPTHKVTIHRHFEKTTISYIEIFLHSILKNLLSNAFKYCRENVPLCIEIRTQQENNYTLLSIKDNGLGIDMEKYGEKLFSPFHRIKSKNTKGTGIGLYLIKDIIEKNGGYITVESTPGKETKFICYLREY